MKTILIVEDDVIIALATGKQLQEAGYDTIQSTSGEKAIEIIETQEIHLVLMDINLGSGMDGIQTAEKIHEFSNLPIVFLSSYSDKATTERIRNISKYGYVVKGTGKFVLAETIFMAFELFHVYQKFYEEQEHFRSLLDTPTDYAIFRIRGDRHQKLAEVVEVSPVITQMLGIDAEDRYNFQKWLTGFRVDNSQQWQNMISDIETGRKVDQVARYIHPDSGVRWFRIQANIVFLDHRKDGSLFCNGIIRDITREKENIDKLKFNSEILEQISDKVTVTDLNGIIEYNNKATLDFFQKNEADLIGKSVIKFARTAEGQAREKKLLADTKKMGHSSMDMEFLDRDGQTKYLNIRTNTIHDSSGQPIGMCSVSTDITKDKIMTRRLSQSEHLFRSIWESVDDSMRLTDSNGVILMVNPAFCKLFEKNESELLGNPFTDLYKNFSKKDLEKYTQNFKDERIVGSFEKEIQLWNGKQKWLGFSAAFVDMPGKGKCVLTVLHDLTQIKLNESILRQSMEKANQYLNVAAELILSLDREGNITLLNESGAQILGYDQGELIGKNWFGTCLPPDIRENIATFFKQLMSGEREGLDQFTNPILTKQGEIRYIRFHNTILRENGRIVGALSSGTDITESEKIEMERRELSERLNLALSAANIGIWEWNLEQNQLVWNTQMYRIYGLEKGSEPLNYDCWEKTLHPDDVEKAVSTLNDAILNFKDYDNEYRIVWPDKSVHHIKAEAKIYRRESGEPYRIIGVDYDISNRIKMEQQLVHIQKIEAIGTLVAGVSHDFNNLLTVILGNAQVLKYQLPAGSEEYAEARDILEAAETAGSLTQQLLLFSRKKEMNFLPINLNELIQNILKMLKRLIGENIEIETKLADDLLIIEGDRTNIEQVIINIAVNARDAMPEGGILRISSANGAQTGIDESNAADNNRAVRLVLEDTGTGMSESIRDKIFEPFFTTKSVGAGTGMGLSVVYGIIKKHNGNIQVESEPGNGSRFIIELPASSEALTDNQIKSNPLDMLQGKGEWILFVEDNQFVNKYGFNILKSSGYNVDAATNAQEAIELFKIEYDKYDLILSDVVLPDRNGIVLVDELMHIRDNIPVIMCSGYTDEASKKEIINHRNIPFIQKPFNVEELLNRIHSEIHKRKQDN